MSLAQGKSLKAMTLCGSKIDQEPVDKIAGKMEE